MPELSIREATWSDLTHIVNYWHNASPEYLRAMGADPAKMPPRDSFHKMLEQQLLLPLAEKSAYIIIWLIGGEPVGHCHANQITFGSQANMHLHLWQAPQRQKGIGTELVRRALPMFFNNLQLKKLICEPYAHNPAPNKTLEKVGFVFERKYRTIPGSINFEQEVNRWGMTAKQFAALNDQA